MIGFDNTVFVTKTSTSNFKQLEFDQHTTSFVLSAMNSVARVYIRNIQYFL